jgi:hypothetical protein
MNSTLADQLGLDGITDYGRLPGSILIAGLSVLFTLVWTMSKKRYGDMDNLRGPKSPSWLMGKAFSYRLVSVYLTNPVIGNLTQLLLKVPFGRDELHWLQEYGMAYKIKGCLGVRSIQPCNSNSHLTG